MTLIDRIDRILAEAIHFEEGVAHSLEREITGLCSWWSEHRHEHQGPATTAVLDLGEDDMALTVDSTTGTVTVSFVDDKGNATDAPANLGPITFTSDNEAVATIVTDPTVPLQGNITPVSIGAATIGVAAFVDATGAPLVLADGVTPFPVPAGVSISVTAAPAAAAVLTVSE